MSSVFDPYHRWLGIPADEQPADHYRLLGLARFEDEAEVIRDAAERQMAHVRGYALGQHADLSQKVLNELAAAKACLLDPAKKTEYDQRLRRDMAASKPVSPPAIPHISKSPRLPGRPAPPKRASTETRECAPGGMPSPSGGMFVGELDSGRPARFDAGTFNRKLLIVVAAAAALLLAVVLGVIISTGGSGEISSGGTEQLAATGPAVPVPPETPPAEKPAGEEGQRATSDAGAPQAIHLKDIPPREDQVSGEDHETESSVPAADPRQPPNGRALTPSRAAPPSEPQEEEAGTPSEAGLVSRQPWQPRSTPWAGMRAVPGLPQPQPATPPGTGRIATLPVPGPPASGRKDYLITLPSGNTLSSSLFEVSRRDITNEANDLLLGCVEGSGPPASHISAGLSHPNGSLMALFRCKAARKVKGRKLDGVLIGFYQNQHTLEAYLNAVFPPTLQGRPVLQRLRVLRNPPIWTGFWADAYPKLYVTYVDGKKNGWLKSWDEQFRKRYWCQYLGDRRNGLCCFFENDEPAMVLECEGDLVSAIHSISGGKLVKSYVDEDQVKQDPAAALVWDRLVRVENELNEYERSIREKKKRGEEEQKKELARRRNIKSRQEMLDSIKARGDATSRFFGGMWRAGTARGSVR